MSSPLGPPSNRLGYVDQNRIALNAEAREEQAQQIAEAQAAAEALKEEMRLAIEAEKKKRSGGGSRPSWNKGLAEKKEKEAEQAFLFSEEGEEIIEQQQQELIAELQERAEAGEIDLANIGFESHIENGELITEVTGITGTVAGTTQKVTIDSSGNVKVGKSRGTTPGEQIVEPVSSIVNPLQEAFQAAKEAGGELKGFVYNFDKEGNPLGGIVDITQTQLAQQNYHYFVDLQEQFGQASDNKVYFNPDPINPYNIQELENKPGASKVIDGIKYTLQEDGMIKVEPANDPIEYSPNIAEQLYSSTVGLGGQTAAGMAEGISYLTEISNIKNEQLSKGLESFASQARKFTSLESLSSLYKGIGQATGIKSYDYAAQHALEQSKAEIPAVSPIGAGIGGIAGAFGVKEGQQTVDTFIEQTMKRPLQTLVTGGIDFALLGGPSLVKGSLSALRALSALKRAPIPFWKSRQYTKQPFMAEHDYEIAMFEMKYGRPAWYGYKPGGYPTPQGTSRPIVSNVRPFDWTGTEKISSSLKSDLNSIYKNVGIKDIESKGTKSSLVQITKKTESNIPPAIQHTRPITRTYGLGGGSWPRYSGSLGFGGATGAGRKRIQPTSEDQYLRYPPKSTEITKNLQNSIVNNVVEQSISQRSDQSLAQSLKDLNNLARLQSPSTAPLFQSIPKPIQSTVTRQETAQRTATAQLTETLQLQVPIEVPTFPPIVPTRPGPTPTRTPIRFVLPPFAPEFDKKKRKKAGKDRGSIFTFQTYEPADLLGLTFGSSYTKRVPKRTRERLRLAD